MSGFPRSMLSVYQVTMLSGKLLGKRTQDLWNGFVSRRPNNIDLAGLKRGRDTLIGRITMIVSNFLIVQQISLRRRPWFANILLNRYFIYLESKLDKNYFQIKEYDRLMGAFNPKTSNSPKPKPAEKSNPPPESNPPPPENSKSKVQQ